MDVTQEIAPVRTAPDTTGKGASTNPLNTGYQNGLSLHIDSHQLVRRVVIFCVVIELLLVVLDLSVYFRLNPDGRGITGLLNLASEESLGTWFSSTQTLMVAIILWLIRFRLRREPAATGARIAGWTLLAVFFTYMAVDDAIALHENLGSAFENFYSDLDDESLGALGTWYQDYPSYTWQLVVGPLFVAMGLFLLVFLWRELQRPGLRWLMVLALGCFSLAVAMDYVEGVYGGYKAIIVATGWQYETVLHTARVIEEFIEMLGTTLFLAAFLYQLTAVSGDIRLSFTQPRQD